ncbi:helicase [Mycobacterium sp. IS-3022]|nr:helicase [Mycobacterium sp. IS-3022]
MIAVLLTITVGAAYLGVAVAARHRAQAAADLGALAAAHRIATGVDAACASAAEVTTAMRANMTRCEVDDLDVVVAVDVSVRLGRLGLGPARAVARAGPGDPVG